MATKEKCILKTKLTERGRGESPGSDEIKEKKKGRIENDEGEGEERKRRGNKKKRRTEFGQAQIPSRRAIGLLRKPVALSWRAYLHAHLKMARYYYIEEVNSWAREKAARACVPRSPHQSFLSLSISSLPAANIMACTK